MPALAGGALRAETDCHYGRESRNDYYSRRRQFRHRQRAPRSTRLTSDHEPLCLWRRGWDSNPRNGSPFTAFPVLPIQPLLHLSPRRISDFGLRIAEFQKSTAQKPKRLGSKTNPQSEFRNLKSSHPLIPRRETISLYW